MPVYAGTDQATLELGAGFVEGTTPLGQRGHSAVSAHRTTHFKPLRRIAVGEVVEVALANEVQRFVVAETFVTDALDVSVLEPTDDQVLTLITCHPFDYVGFAPDRFIVRATRVQKSDKTPQADLHPIP